MDARCGAEAATGRPMRRREDERLITGHGRYVDDIRLDEALYVTFVRSMSARGRIVSIDTELARALPGVVAVFTGDDVEALGDLSVNQVLQNVCLLPFPVLASGTVGAVGQPVAAIVATTPHHGADAAEQILVEIEDAAG